MNKEKYTFDDLIDVAVQAVKDGLLVINRLDDDFISAKLTNKEDQDENFIFNYGHKGEFEYSINKIKSLYTETFVINVLSDVPLIKVGATIKLTNGCEIEAERIYKFSDIWIVDTTYLCREFTLNYLTLKGATVTQRREVSNGRSRNSQICGTMCRI